MDINPTLPPKTATPALPAVAGMTLQLNRTHHLSWRELLAALPDNSVDLILTDPAYDSLNKWRGIGTTARMGMGRPGSGNDDRRKFFATIPNDDLPDMLREFYRVLKPTRHCYIFSDWDTLHRLRKHALEIFPVQKVSGVEVEPFKPIIWDKETSGMGYSYRNRHEYIAFLWKGKKRKLADLSVPDVLRFKRVPPTQAFVPTQKPDDLVDLLIRQSSAPGDLVTDPFMGSGTTARACSRLGRRWLGSDIDPQHVEYANQLQEAHCG